MPDCPICSILTFPCLVHAERWAERIDPDGRDVEWAEWGPRCCFCSRSMVRRGLGWVCGCGLSIDKEGRDA